jgi:long-subunit fatty acid transport protein
VGFELLRDVLYLGAGFNMWQSINVEEMAARIDLAGNLLSKETDVNGDFEIGAITGILFKPARWLSLAYTYRAEMAQDDPTLMKATIDLGRLAIPVQLTLPFRDYFLPWNMTGGLAIRPIEPLVVSVDVTFYHWSDFNLPMWKGRYNEWDDTIVPRLGIECMVWKDLFLRTGYYYEESPVPDQGDIRSNYLDLNKHVLSAGIGYSFTRLPLVGALPFRYPVCVDGFFQYQFMEDRTQRKDPSTVQEGWSIEGYQYALGMGITTGF